MVEVKWNIPDDVWAALVAMADIQGESARDMVLRILSALAEDYHAIVAPDEEE